MPRRRSSLAKRRDSASEARRNSDGGKTEELQFLLNQYLTSADNLSEVLDRADQRVSTQAPDEEAERPSILPWPVAFLRSYRNQLLCVISVFILGAIMLWNMEGPSDRNRDPDSCEELTFRQKLHAWRWAYLQFS
eukprot:1567092-Rhodomonas_salina.1